MKNVNESKLLRRIGRNLKSIRVKKGLSLQDAAADLHIGATTLQKIEAGNTNYNLTLFVKICKTYNVKAKSVLGSFS